MTDDVEMSYEDGQLIRKALGDMTDAEIAEACRTVAGFFTRPGDIAYLTDQVRAFGIEHMFYDSDRGVVVTYAGKHLAFTTGIEPLDLLIADLLSVSEQIAAAMLIMHAAREHEWAESPQNVQAAIAKLQFRYGGREGKPEVTSEGTGPGAGENKIGEMIWNHFHGRRAGSTFQDAKGTMAYEDTIGLARQIAQGG